MLLVEDVMVWAVATCYELIRIDVKSVVMVRFALRDVSVAILKVKSREYSEEWAVYIVLLLPTEFPVEW